MRELPLFGDDVPAFLCGQCEDTGRLAPDCFGPGEPWYRYVAAVKAREEAEGWPPTASEQAVGMIHPVPCPFCPAGRYVAQTHAQSKGKSDASRVSR